MTATMKFITDAVSGGYKPEHYICSHCEEMMMSCDKLEVEKALLDPLAWQAVGKTRGWKEPSAYWTKHEVKGDTITLLDAWECNFHTFIRNLADGKSIEESLKALTTEV